MHAFCDYVEGRNTFGLIRSCTGGLICCRGQQVPDPWLHGAGSRDRTLFAPPQVNNYHQLTVDVLRTFLPVD